MIGGTSSIFGPAICAVSLGVVGHAAFDIRQGRNQAFNSAGNVTAAVAMGLLGYLVSNRSIFFLVVALSVPTILVLLLIRPDEIDYEVARGAKEGDKVGKPVRAYALLKDRPLVVFLVCAVMFHFANAAMLPLLGEMLAKGQGRNSMMFMSACVVTTQFVITLLASWSGRKAGSWGRKPLLLVAFGVLPIRGVLYTLTANTGALVTIAIVTHNLQQAQRVADKTGFFYVDTTQGGRTGYLVEFGDTKQIFGDPAEKRTQEYIRGKFS